MQLKLAMDRMVMQLHKLFGSILLCIVALLLVALMLLMNELNSSLRVQLDQSFRGAVRESVMRFAIMKPRIYIAEILWSFYFL